MLISLIEPFYETRRKSAASVLPDLVKLLLLSRRAALPTNFHVPLNPVVFALNVPVVWSVVARLEAAILVPRLTVGVTVVEGLAIV
jgi:hypothetical protein